MGMKNKYKIKYTLNNVDPLGEKTSTSALMALKNGGGKRRKKKTRKKRGGLEEEIHPIQPFPVNMISEQARNTYNNNENIRNEINQWWAGFTHQQRHNIIMGDPAGIRWFWHDALLIVIDDMIAEIAQMDQQQGGR